MDYVNVSKELSRQELNDLAEKAFAPPDGDAFSVESITNLGSRKEVGIKYLTSGKKKTITVGTYLT